MRRPSKTIKEICEEEYKITYGKERVAGEGVPDSIICSSIIKFLDEVWEENDENKSN